MRGLRVGLGGQVQFDPSDNKTFLVDQNITEDTTVTPKDPNRENSGDAYLKVTQSGDVSVAAGKTLMLDWSKGTRIGGVTVSGGKFTNNGTIEVIGNAPAELTDETIAKANFWKIKAINIFGGEAINKGTIRATDAYAVQVSESSGGKFTNDGTIIVEGVGTAIDAATKENTTVINTGDIIVHGENATAAFLAKGTFTNTGTIFAEGTALEIQSQYDETSEVTVILDGQSKIIGDVDLNEKATLTVTDKAIAQTIDLVDAVGTVENNSALTINQAREEALTITTLKTAEGSSTNFKLSQVGTADEKVLTVTTVDSKGTVGVGYTGEVSDGLTKGDVEANNLLAGIQLGNEKVESVTVDQGVYGDEYVATEDGLKVTTVNTLLTSAQDLALANAYMWRSELSSLSDRMGTLRTTPEKAGAWARYTNGRFDGDAFRHDFNTVEIGADMPIADNIMVGVSFDYTKGESELTAGTSDNDSYSLGLYGSYFNDNGSFLDAMFKLGRIDSDYSFDNGFSEKGDYMLTGVIFGVEAGHRWTVNNWFIEPQVQLTYSYLKSEDYDTNLRNVKFDGMDSLIARVGVMGGVNFAQDKGSAYVKLSYNHDFMGDVEGNYTTEGVTRTFKDELDDNWGEAAIGASYQISNQLNTFVDVRTSFGGDIDQKWRFNIGARYAF